MSLARNPQLRLAALLFGTILPAMFVVVLLTVASVPEHAQSLTTRGVSGNRTDATAPGFGKVDRPVEFSVGNVVTEKEKI